MTTTEQIQDLQPGDVVEAYRTSWPEGTKLVGPVYADREALCVGGLIVGWTDGSELDADKVITVVSRAPRSLYVNHPRTQTVLGDVVRDADDVNDTRTWCNDDDGHLCWQRQDDGNHNFYCRNELPARLRLLVDGETGQAVQ